MYDKSRNSLKVYPLGKKDTSFYIPSNILVLERFCFHANSYLENLIINDNLTTIHSEALRGCTNLKTISIGKGVRSEERRVGKECRSRWSPYH